MIKLVIKSQATSAAPGVPAPVTGTPMRSTTSRYSGNARRTPARRSLAITLRPPPLAAEVEADLQGETLPIIFA